MNIALLNVVNHSGRELGPRRVSLGSQVQWSDYPERGGEPEGWLVPGFVDLHIHGAFGVDFMTAKTSDLVRLSEELRSVGYDAWLPTTVTAPLGDVTRALSQLPDGDPSIAGFHLEGPFISPKHPGAQPAQHILRPDQAEGEWDKVLRDPRLKVVTMAPEEPGGMEMVRKLAARRVRVSMGHTDATWDQARKAIGLGVCHATHTYNAMRGLHHREPGTVGAVLSDDRVMAELIYDRVHVHPGAARILLLSKTLEGVIAISDGTMASGMPSGTEFEAWGHKVVTQDGQVRLKSNGALAGSAITLKDAFENLAQDFGVAAAVFLTSVNPRKALRLRRLPRTWVQFDPNFRFVRAWSC